MTTTADRSKDRPSPEEVGAPGGSALDTMLADAAGPVRRWLPGTAGLRLVGHLAGRPRAVARRTGGLAAELAKVVAGRSEVTAPKGDRRFTDPAWQGNPVLLRLCQGYLATASTAMQLVDDADLDWRDDHRVRFLAGNVLDAVAPSNVPMLNPAAVKAAIDSGGRNYLKGGTQLVKDVARRRTPAMVDETAFEVGRELAITEGQVVLRTPVVELIQYSPRAARVREVPLLVVPPMINKYYVTDLAPGRSMVESYLDSGLQVFAMSWRNPTAEHAAWGLDTYAGAVLECLDAVEKITGSGRTHVLGVCAGGITSSVALSHLAATSRLDRVATLSLGVTVLDQERAGTMGSFVDKGMAATAVAGSQRRGYLDGKALAGVFAWLRPNDLVWNYWVNNYLLGKRPPAFDVLYWNADSTRMPAGLHRDFLEMAVDNSLVTPGRARVLGSPVDLGKLDVDSYLVAGVADHICPWQNCYRSTQMLGGTKRFVLSTSGHIAALVNPPGNPKATYSVHEDECPPDPEQWKREAVTRQGTWWTDHTAWLGERSGGDKAAPKTLGAKGYRPLQAAPGAYVLER